jgi:predicted PurR-regulated permease PerM
VSDVERIRSIIERWIGAAAVAVLALACVLILRPFISAALWAAILCFTTWPLFTRLKAKLGGRSTMAASLATLALSAIIIAPVAILVSRLSGNVAEMIQVLSLIKQHGHERVRAAVEEAVALGCSDAAAILHQAAAADLTHSRGALIELGELARFERPLPMMTDYDGLLGQEVVS